MNLSISPPPPLAKHRLSYEPCNLAPPPPKLILSTIRWFLALDCLPLPAKSKTKLKLCYASFRDDQTTCPATVPATRVNL